MHPVARAAPVEQSLIGGGLRDVLAAQRGWALAAQPTAWFGLRVHDHQRYALARRPVVRPAGRPDDSQLTAGRQVREGRAAGQQGGTGGKVRLGQLTGGVLIEVADAGPASYAGRRRR